MIGLLLNLKTSMTKLLELVLKNVRASDQSGSDVLYANDQSGADRLKANEEV